jgi:carboxymethylenebutenolidase
VLTDKAAIGKIQASLLGNFAGQDRGIPPADVKQFEEAMKAAKKDVDVKLYEPNGHAFMNPDNKEGYHEKAAQDAWRRIDAFFAKKLKG